MTEQEWLTATNSGAMLTFLRGRRTMSDRKARLFVAACCRRNWRFLAEEQTQNGVEVAEEYADRLATAAELASAHRAAGTAFFVLSSTKDAQAYYAVRLIVEATLPSYRDHFGICMSAADMAQMAPAVTYPGYGNTTFYERGTREIERAGQAGILRDLFGSLPFRTVPLNPAWVAWNGGTVKLLAESVYRERLLLGGYFDATRMSILADALEDAGCDNPDILNHCRQPVIHVRGCWVIDLLLGKE